MVSFVAREKGQNRKLLLQIELEISRCAEVLMSVISQHIPVGYRLTECKGSERQTDTLCNDCSKFLMLLVFGCKTVLFFLFVPASL